MSTRRAAFPTIQHYIRRNRHAASDLVFRSYRVHSHLDWSETDEWLERDELPIRLAWSGERLTGLLGMSKPLNGTCWIRLAAISDYGDGSRIFSSLWEDLVAELNERGVHTIAVLITRDWILTYLRTIGFKPSEDIVTLERPKLPILDAPPPDDIAIRLVRSDEIDALAQVDHQAFSPPWQMERADIRQAEKISSIGTVALREGQVVGYALCTVFIDGAHLARLAVAPEQQGRGVASAILADLLRRFERRSIYRMTVNTQASNVRSQRLYQRFGFARNGYDLPVWMFQLTPTIPET